MDHPEERTSRSGLAAMIFHLAAALFLVVAAVFLLVLIGTIRPVANSAVVWLDETRSLMAETRKNQEALAASLARISAAVPPMLQSGQGFLQGATSAVEESRRAQRELMEKADRIEAIAGEITVAAAVVGMAEQGMIPSTEAEEMIKESIEAIEKESPRLGKLARYINNQRLTAYFGQSSILNQTYEAQAKALLMNLAQAQELYRVNKGAYAMSIEDLKEYLTPSAEVELVITSADAHSWRGTARHMALNRLFEYDSGQGEIR
jgi:hypothetical protein